MYDAPHSLTLDLFLSLPYRALKANESHTNNNGDLNRDTNGTQTTHLVVSQYYSQLLPPRPLPLITLPLTDYDGPGLQHDS
jgi:hypothetical protein